MMANNRLFSAFNSRLARADTVNEAGGRAYSMAPKHALAQVAATGCFNGTYYATAEHQLDQLRQLIEQVDDNVFLAKLAVYARERGYMKDMPAALLVVLSTRDSALMRRVFNRVVDNGRMLRTVFQMIRSGQFGRRSLSYALQRAFQRWLNNAPVEALLSASIGMDPSLRDVMRLARPTPADNARRALYGWLVGKDPDAWGSASQRDLPAQVQALIAYRNADTEEAQARIVGDLSVRWDLLADAAKGPLVWKAIARKMGPQALRMNLNTLLRHDVFTDDAAGRELIALVAERLANADAIRRSRQFPYQFLAAYLNAAPSLPADIKAALHRAAEIACDNVPDFPGPVLIGLDVSGSMSVPVTGWRGRGATSAMRCVDVAALFAAAVLRRNPKSLVVPFDTRAYDARIDARDSILSLAERLAQYGGGGTDCAVPLRFVNSKFTQRRFVGAVLISDNESWVYRHRAFSYSRRGETGTLYEWQRFVANQQRLGVRSPKLVCIDIQPYGTTQAPERDDILNIGGFSDAVFNVIASYLNDGAARFVNEVESIDL